MAAGSTAVPTSEVNDWQTVAPKDPGDWQTVKPPAPPPGPLTRLMSGIGEGSGISGLWDSLKNISGAKTISDAKDDWDKGNHAKAIFSLLDFARRGGPGGKIASGLIDTSKDQAAKAVQAVKDGRYNDAFLHANAVLLPMVAPSVDAQEKLKQPGGDLAHEGGVIIGNLGSIAAPAAAESLLPESVAAGRVASSLTPEEQVAVDFANKSGAGPGGYSTRPGPEIPIPASTATGDKFVKNVQAIAANQPLGSFVAKSATKATRAAMEQTADELASKVGPPATAESAGTSLQLATADREAALKAAQADQDAAVAQRGEDIASTVHPSPQTPETAGAGAAQALQSTAKAQGSGATSAYSRLSEIENDPANVKKVQIGTEPNPDLDKLSQTLTGKPFDELSPRDQQKVIANAPRFGIDPNVKPITKDIALPVDMRPVRASLQPIYDDLKAQMPIAQQQASRGLKAIENIVNGDDYVPASIAETNLGAVKAIQREAVNAKTAYLAGQAVKSFTPAVDSAVAGAGTEAADALAQGRALTKAKYATQATMDALPTEPVQIFNRLTAPNDANINLLRDVKAKSPDAIPSVARATIQGLFEDAKAGGATKALNEWGKIGDATKLELLGDAAKVATVDRYLKMAKSLEDSSYPAGMEAPPEKLPTEPVPAYQKVVQAHDQAIEALRGVANTAPNSIPQIARAKLQELLDAAVAPEGTAPGPSAAFSNWNKLGDATKQILFPDPVLRKNLDAYFSLAKKLAENPNPSGSAVVAHSLTSGIIALGNPLTGAAWTLGGYGLAKLLYSPRGAALLSRGLTVPVSEPAAAATLANQIVKLAGNDAKVIVMPKAAKSATPDDIKEYATAKGITEDAARKEFADHGYAVKQ